MGEYSNCKNSFGGDLRGIIEKIDYLKEIGVDLIYLTPIFESSSNHKYNTKDYYKIDPQFGTLDDAKELVKKVHDNGMYILFDAVFNHSGDDFFAFKNLKEEGEKSKYLSWYHLDGKSISKKGCNYYTFANSIKSMPKFRTENEEVRKYLFEVGKYWIDEIGIDGYRLDVCDEVDHRFWRDFKSEIVKVKKDAILVGEIMHESGAFLKGNELDSIMNYPFKNAMVEFFAKRMIDEDEFLDILAINRNIYMDKITRQLWNLLGSHDTARFLTECNNIKERLMLAINFQFTYIGVPYIYYGDEVGMVGGHDPLYRGCMIWDEDKRDKEIFDLYKKLIQFRFENKDVLVYGSFKTLYSKNNVIAYERTKNDKSMRFILNNNDVEKNVSIKINGKYRKFNLKPLEFKIFT